MRKLKIIVFQGGLGNQLFQYAFLCKLREDGYVVQFLNNANGAHNGFEIQKYFETKMKPCHSICGSIYKQLDKLYRHGVHFVFSTEDNFAVWKTFQIGYWQDIDYMPKILPIKFKEMILDDKNQAIINIIKNTNSIAIHIRRGDYLLPPHNKVFAGICTREYYAKAIKIIKMNFCNPYFIFFSNDIEWVRENIIVQGDTCEYVDWNVGDKSVFDMYLMSQCKGNILANSTFSYWGARLGRDNVVVYPKKWFNTMESPHIFPQNWIGI